MIIRQAAAREGVLWMRAGIDIFKSKPLGFLSLLGTFLFMSFLAGQIPYLGGVLILMAVPWMNLTFMAGTHECLHGRVPSPVLYLQLLKGKPRGTRQLAFLGLAYACATALLMYLCDVLDGGALQRLQEAMAQTTPATDAQMQTLMQDPLLSLGMGIRLLATALVALPFWHAAPLVMWQAQTWPQAVFSSALACWTNLKALLVFMAMFTSLGMAITTGLMLLLLAMGLSAWAAGLIFPLSLLLVSAFYASLYFTFAGCFEVPATDDEAQPTPSP